jgi:2,3-dimethylmalate lyase
MRNPGRQFRDLLRTEPYLFTGGVYSPLDAQIAEKVGMKSIYLSGYSMALANGWPDMGFLTQTEVTRIGALVASAVEIPVIADADDGYGNALSTIRTVQEYVRSGVAGIHIEDQVFPKRCGHMEGKQVIEAEEMAGKVRAMVDVRRRLASDIVINARTDAFAVHGLHEAIFRCNLYLDAGADMVFIDGIGTRADIQRAVREVNGLLSVNLMDGVTGVKTELIPIPELAAIGVARVSIPVASILVMHRALTDFFTSLHDSPTGLLVGETRRLTSFRDYTDFVGLPEYRALERQYLPTLTGIER